MYKSCSKCGKIHDSLYKCPKSRIYNPTNEGNIRNTHSWHKKAEEIKRKSNYLCELCKDEHRYTYDNLEVHHIDKIKDKPERLLDNYKNQNILLQKMKKYKKFCISRAFLY